MTESASIQTTKNRKRLDADRAVFSLFGEYQKDLYEEYEVFAIDGTYETGQFNENLLLERMSYYGSTGIQQEITDIQFLTDNNGQAFREQVMETMESRIGISLVQNLAGMAESWEEREIQGEVISQQLEDTLSGEQELLPEEAYSLINAKKGGLLFLVLPKTFQLSNKSIRLSEQVSGRTRHIGRGSFPERVHAQGVEGKVLFEKYILEKFSHAMEKKSEKRNLDYEIEYFLCGKESDVENLKSTVNQLLMFRFAMNYKYLLSDIQKQQEAESMAVTISLLLMNPELEQAIKQVLLILWSFGESVMDIRSLLSGKKCAFNKKTEDWQLQLSGLFRLGTEEDMQEGGDTENGLTYQQYLQILLFLKSGTELTMRTLDRVEQNLIQEKGLLFFRADYCVTKIKLHNTTGIWNGLQYEFPLYFGYL